MKIAVISFTAKGTRINLLLKEKYKIEGYETQNFFKGKKGEDKQLNCINKALSEWCSESFKNFDAFVFIGACAIAVRAIAPCINSKATDPAVIVIDENKNYVISLLSGHIGGANALAVKTAELLNAMPVITTATDVNDLFAIDVFAKNNNLHIDNIKKIKDVSSKVVNGEKIIIKSDLKIQGNPPTEVILAKEIKTYDKYDLDDEYFDVWITYKDRYMQKDKVKEFSGLKLTASSIVIGMGCKKNTSYESLKDFLEDILKQYNIDKNSVFKIASIDLKKDEEGLKKLAKYMKAEFETFSEKELLSVKGEFSESEFVKSITGVGNVCERAALLGADNGKIILQKQSRNGMTIAIAMTERRIYFE